MRIELSELFSFLLSYSGSIMRPNYGDTMTGRPYVAFLIRPAKFRTTIKINSWINLHFFSVLGAVWLNNYVLWGCFHHHTVMLLHSWVHFNFGLLLEPLCLIFEPVVAPSQKVSPPLMLTLGPIFVFILVFETACAVGVCVSQLWPVISAIIQGGRCSFGALSFIMWRIAF